MNVILGLDISTSCTGICVLGEDSSLVDMYAIRLSALGHWGDKARAVKDTLQDIKALYDVQGVFIEENLQSFRRGFSSAQTLSTLARFNGIVSYLCLESYDLNPVFFNVNSARKSLGIKIISKKKGGSPVKEQVLEWSITELAAADWTWPKKILKSGPRKGAEINDPVCYDLADAYVIARAGIKEIS